LQVDILKLCDGRTDPTLADAAFEDGHIVYLVLNLGYDVNLFFLVFATAAGLHTLKYLLCDLMAGERGRGEVEMQTAEVGAAMSGGR
jgi:hypothetical protein